MTEHSRGLLLVLLVGIGLTLPWLGDKLITTRGEGREMLVIQSMVQRGEWLLGRGYSDAVPSKPPMMHWLAAGLSEVLGGLNEFTGRLPSALASILLACFFFWQCARFLAVREVLLGVFILLVSPEWARAAVACRVDMLLAGAMAGGLLAAFLWLTDRSLYWLLLSWLLFAVSFLAKGPVGVALPALIVALYLAFERQKPTEIIRSLLLLFVIPSIVALCWYAAALSNGGGAFWSKFYYENVERFTSTMEDEPHRHGVIYLFGTFIIGLLPWSLFGLYGLFNSPKKFWGEARHVWSGSNILRFSTIACLAIFLFFSLPSSKRSVYLLPAYPFISLILGAQLYRTNSKWIQNVATGVWIFLILILSAISICWPFVGSLALKGEAAYYLKTLLSSVPWISLAALLAVIALLGRISDRFLRVGLALGAVHLWLLAFALGPLENGLSPKTWAFALSAELLPETKIYSYQTEFYSLSYYLKRTLYRYAPESVRAGDMVIAYRHDEMALRENLKDRFLVRELGARDNVVKAGEEAVLFLVEEKSDAIQS